MKKLNEIEPQYATGKKICFFLNFYYFRRFLDERVLAGKIFLYLERYGYINFGVFKRLTSPLGSKNFSLQIIKKMFCLAKKDKPRVIVIGAGIAGIIAARQLQYFGFETIILEGRVRIFVETK
jgi:lysine-specific histone demethylase 1